MLLLPQEYLFSSCEIKTISNDLICTGQISKITPDYIQIANASERMPLIKYNTRIKINVFNSRQGFRALVGKTYISTAKFIRVFDLMTVLDFERRDSYRVNVNLKATLHIQNDLQTNEKDCKRHIDININNLSIGGASFYSEYAFNINDKILIDLYLPEGTLSIPCKVRRMDMDSYPLINYGCKFCESEKQADLLYKYIFRVHKEQIKSKKL